ncbi:MAG: von Willebrand factor type A domain-containing protein [Planctomycetaceae bacterium]
MSHAPMTPDDPRLTAYVLGELEPADAAAVEASLANSDELRQVVEDLRTTSADLFAALQAEPKPTGRLELPIASVQRKSSATAKSGVPPYRRGLMLVNAVILLLLIGVAVSLQGRPDGQPVAGSGRDLAQLSADEVSLLKQKIALEEQHAIWKRTYGESSLSALGVRQEQTPLEATRDEFPARRAMQQSAQPAPQNQSDRSVPQQTFLGGRWVALDRRIEKSPPASQVVREFDLTRPLVESKTPSGQKPKPGAYPDTSTSSHPSPPLPGKPDSQREASGELQGVVNGQPMSRFGAQPATNQSLSEYDAMLLVTPRIIVGEAGEGLMEGEQSVRLRTMIDQHSGQLNSLRVPALATGIGYTPRPQVPTGCRSAEVNWTDQCGGAADGPDWRWLRPEFREQADVGTESYAPVHENDFTVPTGEDALSTFSLDVDTASYSNVRRFLNQNQLPPPDAVRLEELVNYFDYDLPQPVDDDPFSVTLDATSCPWAPKHRLVRIGLQGREIDRSQRPLTRLVFLLDVSGSMSNNNKLPLVKQSMQLLVDQLGENDRIAIVTYAGRAELKLDSTSGSDRETIQAAIHSLSAGGSTNGAGGIQLAYDIAAKHFLKDAANRVILCTDGDFNVGISSDDELVRLIEEKRDSGLFLSIFGYGMGNLKDSKLEGLADKGNGHYGYIDNLDEARKVFIEELAGLLYTIAKDVKLQIEFNPEKVASYRLLGYENRTLAAADFNNDQVDAGEMGAGHTVTALYEIVPTSPFSPVAPKAVPAVDPLKYQPGAESLEDAGSPESRVLSDGNAKTSTEVAPNPQPSTLNSRELLTVKLRYKQPDGEESVKREFPLDDHPQRCSEDLQFAAAVTGFGLLLRNSQYASDCNWDLVIELAEGATGEDEGSRRSEFIDLARQARRLWQAAYPHGSPAVWRQRLTSLTPSSAADAVITGTVVLVDESTQSVWINCGTKSGVQPRMTFDVTAAAQQSDADPQSHTALLEVVQVQPDTARCRILEADLRHPVAVGDQVHGNQPARQAQ